MAAVPTTLPITVQTDAGSLQGTFVPSSSTLSLPSRMPSSHCCCSECKTPLAATASLHCPTAQADTSPHPGSAAHHSLSKHTAVLSLSPFHSHTQVPDCPQAPISAALPDCSRAHPHPYLIPLLVPIPVPIPIPISIPIPYRQPPPAHRGAQPQHYIFSPPLSPFPCPPPHCSKSFISLGASARGKGRSTWGATSCASVCCEQRSCSR